MLTRRLSMLCLLGLLVACGDRVLGGTTGACASYGKGSLHQPSVSVADYCAAVERICGFSERPVGEPAYLSLADCETKYAAETSVQRACSAGYVCEAEATGAATMCTTATLTCPNL